MTDDLDQLDAALRRDIRRLGAQLGDTLVRQVGPDLLDQVEQVRTLARALREGDDSVGEELTDSLGDTDVIRAIELVRAFTTYFHLANTAEQVHRIDDLAENRTTRSKRISETVARLIELGFSADEVAAAVNKVQLYPVFTAHPTEVRRRSVLDHRNRIADLMRLRNAGEGRTPEGDEIEAAIQPNTKLLLAETIGNPRGDVAHFEALADVAHRNGIPLAIDIRTASDAGRPPAAGEGAIADSFAALADRLLEGER